MKYSAGYSGPMVPAGQRPKGPEIGFPVKPTPPAPKPQKDLPAGTLSPRGAVTGGGRAGPSKGPEIGFPIRQKPPVVAMKKGGVVAKKAAPKKAGPAVKQKR